MCLTRSFVSVVSLSVGFALGEFADVVLLLHSCYYDRDDCLMSCVFLSCHSDSCQQWFIA
jgi:hypothetical protein